MRQIWFDTALGLPWGSASRIRSISEQSFRSTIAHFQKLSFVKWIPRTRMLRFVNFSFSMSFRTWNIPTFEVNNNWFHVKVFHPQIGPTKIILLKFRFKYGFIGRKNRPLSMLNRRRVFVYYHVEHVRTCSNEWLYGTINDWQPSVNFTKHWINIKIKSIRILNKRARGIVVEMTFAVHDRNAMKICMKIIEFSKYTSINIIYLNRE